MSSTAEKVEEVGGTEKEYFFEGTATRYRLADGVTEYPTNGRWEAEAIDEQPFRTRMLVLCPDPAQFNGTVIVEWNNVSAGENFFLNRSAPQLLGDGFAVVGVSAQYLGVEGMPGMPVPSLKTENPQRYASMHHPSDDYSYDIFAQAGELLGPQRPHDVDPLEGLDVRHLIAVGVSQSSARLGGYLNGVHAVSSIYDAFLLVVYPNSPCALNGDSAPAELPQTYGPNGFHLLEWYKHFLREDLDVPIIVLNSESEASECYPNTQSDTELLRWWEVAGTSHTSVATADELEAMGFVVGTHVAFAPALRGALHALQRWLDAGEAPQHQPRLVREGSPPALSPRRARECRRRHPMARPCSAARHACGRTGRWRREQPLEGLEHSVPGGKGPRALSRSGRLVRQIQGVGRTTHAGGRHPPRRRRRVADQSRGTTAADLSAPPFVVVRRVRGSARGRPPRCCGRRDRARRPRSSPRDIRERPGAH